jgi:hypothetical protein
VTTTLPRPFTLARAVVLAAACGAAPAGAGCAPGPIDAVELDPTSLEIGLLAHWSFDDGAGATVTDNSGNGHDGTIIAGTWMPAAHFGGVLHIEGGAGATPGPTGVVVPTFPPPVASWTVAGWVRTPRINTGSNYETIVSTELLDGGGWQLNLRMDMDAIPANLFYQFAYWIGPDRGNNTFHNCTCVGAPDEWVHIAGVIDRSTNTLSFYRNGALDGSEPATDPIVMASPTLYFGRWPADDLRNLTGDLDDFVIYNRALTRREIKALASAPLVKRR